MWGTYMGLGIAFGVAIGAGMGAATGHMAQWVGSGAAIGVAIGLLMNRTACPASSILSGQRQLDFPILFERYQQQSGLWEKWESRGFCGISKGGGKRGKPAFGFPRFPRPAFSTAQRPPRFCC